MAEFLRKKVEEHEPIRVKVEGSAVAQGLPPGSSGRLQFPSTSINAAAEHSQYRRFCLDKDHTEVAVKGWRSRARVHVLEAVHTYQYTINNISIRLWCRSTDTDSEDWNESHGVGNELAWISHVFPHHMCAELHERSRYT